MKKRLATIAGVALIVLLLAVGAKLFFDKKAADEWELEVQAVALNANEISEHIYEVLTSTAPITWVYDREENLIMTVKVSTALQSIANTPEVVASRVLESCGDNPAAVVVADYTRQQEQAVSAATTEGYTRRILQDYTKDDLVRYLAVSSTYGGSYTGIVAAASDLFGLPITSLNDAQLNLLAEMYRNTGFSLDAYLSALGLNAERLGLLSDREDFAALSSLITEELCSRKELDLVQNSYSVKISLSTAQQAAMQTQVDTATRQLIDLNGDGTFVYDCSAVIVDKNTGQIRAYVPGRSVTGTSTSNFHLNTLSFTENWQALMMELRKAGTFRYSLRQVTKANGDPELKSVYDMFCSLELNTSATTVTRMSALELVDTIFSGNTGYNGISFIYQIQDAYGNDIFKAKDQSILNLENPGICEFFHEDGDARQSYEMLFDLSTGVLAFTGTRDYVLAVVAGSSAIGGTVPSAQRELLKNVVAELRATAASFYPTPTTSLWQSTYADKFSQIAYDTNYAMVRGKFDRMLAQLSDIQVNSSSARIQFEDLYETINTFISKYSENIGELYANGLKEELQEVRLGVSELLLQYSV